MGVTERLKFDHTGLCIYFGRGEMIDVRIVGEREF